MFLLDLIFPKKCVGCLNLGSYFCKDCILEIKQTELVCPKCERLSLGGLVHPVCRRKYGLEGLWSLGTYDKPLKPAIQKLKYKWVTELAEVLINITLEYWAKYQPFLLEQIKKDRGEGWIITAVPLYFTRQNWRGFNQSELLGKLLAKKIGLKYQDLLIKTKSTKPQMSLNSYQRRQNLKNVFSHNSLFMPHNSKVVLVDDVWTTGSTLKECTYILKRNGAKRVWGVTIAR